MAKGNSSASGGAPGLLLAETLCARLCEAAGNAADRPESAARLRLLRAAWAGMAEPLDLRTLTALAAGLPDGVRLKQTGLDQAGRFTPAAGRLLLNAVLLAAEALPQGGVVLASGSEESVMLLPEGPGAGWPRGVIACLAGRAPETPGQVQAWLVALLAEAGGMRANLLLGRANAGPPLLLRF